MPSASWTAPASAQSVGRLRQAVVEFAYEHGVPEPYLSDIGLAVSEAVTNAVVHAFRGRADGTVIASVNIGDRGWVEVRVTDDGSGMAPRDDSPGIGLGLPLIRHLTDQFEHRRPTDGVGTELWMHFRLAPPARETIISAGVDVIHCDARIPSALRGYLTELVERLNAVLGDALLGAYLIGSAALGDWVEKTSDVDVAAVATDGSLTARRLDEIAGLLDQKALPVTARKLELVLYTASSAGSGWPRFSLNFNTGPRDATSDERDPGTVPSFWFVLDIAIARDRAIALLGPPPQQVFAAPPSDAVRDALTEALRWQRSNPEPGSAVLAACRTWRFLEEGQWHGKTAAGRWAMGRLRDSDFEAARAIAALVGAREDGGRMAPVAAPVATRILDRVAAVLAACR
jgi:anti-sigma regulatory factor (Ser/Thr protein kinase)/predicted nucleotidyltransferase